MARIKSTTELYALFGHPVSHSFSPEMQNAAFEAMDIDGFYVAFDILPKDLESAVEAIRSLSIRGVNITIPHKKTVIPLLDLVSSEASDVGAVNTIKNEDGILSGFNTDVDGFLLALREATKLVSLPEKVVVLGAGGAARGVVYALGRQSSVKEVVILNRTVSRAISLAEEMTRIIGGVFRGMGLETDTLEREIPGAGLIVNTTSLGMEPHLEGSPIEEESLIPEGIVLYDCVYNPPTTRLVKMARQRGARACNGLDMLVWQGARSFEIWTGHNPPVDVMRQTLQKKFCFED